VTNETAGGAHEARCPEPIGNGGSKADRDKTVTWNDLDREESEAQFITRHYLVIWSAEMEMTDRLHDCRMETLACQSAKSAAVAAGLWFRACLVSRAPTLPVATWRPL